MNYIITPIDDFYFNKLREKLYTMKYCTMLNYGVRTIKILGVSSEDPVLEDILSEIRIRRMHVENI
jgi:hypothetical protein